MIDINFVVVVVVILNLCFTNKPNIVKFKNSA